MSVKVLLLVLIMISTQLYAQQEDIEFGDVSLTDLTMKCYAKDTSAAAVILFNRGNVIVNANSTTGTTFKRHIRIKIFRKTAFAEWGNMNFFVEKNGLSKYRGATYNLVNGIIQKSEITDIHKTKYDKDTQQISFAFPNVVEGSVIEFVYTSKYEGLYLPSWQFQYSIPVARSQYVLKGPSDITPHLRGSLQLTNHITKNDGSYNEWLMMNIPAFKSEPLMPDQDAYISLIEFVRYKTWESIYFYFIRHFSFGQIISGHNFLNAKVDELIAGMTDPHQKIKTISDYIKQTVQWNGICDYLADDPKEVLKNKSGTAADINLLFASMLKKAGLDVDAVLLSTRNHGLVLEDLPSQRQFNYVVCQVSLNGGKLLLDATEKYLPFDMLPGRCFNHKGFLISDEEYGWIPIEPMKRDKISLNGDFTLTKMGGLTGRLNSLKDGYAAFDARKKYIESGEEEYKKDFVSTHLWDVQSIEILNIKELGKPVAEKYELSIEEYATLSNDLMYFNPYIFLREELNPFVLTERIHPIDFDMIVEKVIVSNIVIPEDYSVEELPQSKTLTMPDNAAKCTFNISRAGNRIFVLSHLQINKTLFMQHEYGNLKEFYARIVAKNSELIILKKKNLNVDGHSQTTQGVNK